MLVKQCFIKHFSASNVTTDMFPLLNGATSFLLSFHKGDS